MKKLANELWLLCLVLASCDAIKTTQMCAADAVKSKQMTTDYYAWCCKVFSVEEEWKRKGEARSRRDKSVMQCCWYVPFPDEDDASCDEENARRRGFSSLAWRTVQPAGNSSSSQWSDSSWNPLNGVACNDRVFYATLVVLVWKVLFCVMVEK